MRERLTALEASPRARAAAPAAAVELGPSGHALYRLAENLLLVFKPRGHTESEHAHAYAQRLLVLRGRLEVATARGARVLEPRSGAYVLAAERRHRTTALADTWLVAERLPASGAPLSSAGASERRPLSGVRSRRRGP